MRVGSTQIAAYNRFVYHSSNRCREWVWEEEFFVENLFLTKISIFHHQNLIQIKIHSLNSCGPSHSYKIPSQSYNLPINFSLESKLWEERANTLALID